MLSWGPRGSCYFKQDGLGRWEMVTFKERLKRMEGESLGAHLGSSTPRGECSKCKGSEAGACLVCLKIGEEGEEVGVELTTVAQGGGDGSWIGVIASSEELRGQICISLKGFSLWDSVC